MNELHLSFSMLKSQVKAICYYSFKITIALPHLAFQSVR